MNQINKHIVSTHSSDIELEQLYTEQSQAEAFYELAVTYKIFGFRNKAIEEFHRLCELRTASADIFLKRLIPQLFH